ELGAGHQPRVDLVGPRMVEPGLIAGNVGFALGREHDAGAAEAGLALHALVHAFPQAEAFDDEGNFARIATGLAHPAPVAARFPPRPVAPFPHARPPAL